MVQNWEPNVKTVVGILSLFSLVFLLPGQVAAQKTALVRTSEWHEVYGNVYQIRFSNRKNLSNHEFEKDFAIYDATGEVKLCLDRHKKTPGEVERWSVVAAELWTAARVLARTPRRTQIFDTTPLIESLNEAVKEFGLGNLVEKELAKQAIGQITSHTFLSKLNIVKGVGTPAITTVPVKVVATLGEIEIKMRRLLYAFWIASGYADTAITLQTLANQRAEQLWTAIDAGKIVDISGGPLNIDVKSGTISGDISIDGPLRLRLAAEVYESNAKQAAQLGADLGDSPDAWGGFLLGLFGVGELVGMVSEVFEAVGVKKDLDKLQVDTASKIERSIDDNINDVYESSRSFYRGGFCWPEVIIYEDPLKYNRVYEGSSLTYTVVLRSDPGFKLTIPVSSDNADVTVFPDSLTFTSQNWYKPQAVTVKAAVDTDSEHDTARLNHEIMGYGNQKRNVFFITVLETPDLPDLVVSISVSKATFAPGESFRLDTTVRNQGTAVSKSTTLRFYRSSDPNISPDDTELHAISINPINVGRQVTPWKRFTVPEVPGVYYYGVCADRTGDERTIDNNCSEAIKITVLQPNLPDQGTVPQQDLPDLVVKSISVSKSTLVPGERFTLSATVRNIGTARSQSGVLRYYEELGEAGNRNIRRLFPDQTMDMSIQLEAPEEPGVYYYDACVSKVRDEVNKDNNCSTRIAITVGTPANQVPIASGTIPDQTLMAGSTAVVIGVSGYFRDPDNDRLTYTGRSDKIGVATVNVSGSQVTLTPKRAGRATVTVTASDGSLTATQRFTVTVTDAVTRNQAPVAVGAIPAQTLAVGAVTPIRVADYFSDSDGDSLTYTAHSDDTSVVTVNVSGSIIAFMPQRAGNATITVKASDAKSTATHRFRVTVVSSSFRVGDAVIVQNSSGGGLNGLLVRKEAGTGAKHIISVFDEATGIIREGPVPADGYIWWLVRWDASDKVFCGDSNPCDGWVFESFRGTRVIAKYTRPRVEISQNRKPVAVGTISDRTLTAGSSSVVVDVSGNFRDPDNNRLSYTVRSDNTGIASVSVSSSQITLTPQEEGITTITVTASDGELTAVQRIRVTVQAAQPINQSPAAVGTISPRTLTVNGAAWRVNVSDYFKDSDGDRLTYTVRSDDTGVATVRESGSEVTITPQGVGNTTIHVTASDGSLEATQSISITVVSTLLVPDLPDLVVESARVSKSALKPGERFTFYATVRNQGTDPASRTTLRYYRSVDSTISKSDTEEDSDSIRKSLNPDQTSEEWDGLRAPNTPGTYYYGACVDSVPNEGNTNNNCSNAIAVTVYAPGPPDLIVENPRVDKSTLDPGERFKFYATVRNQGTGDADSTTLYYNRSNDSNISENDTNERWDSVSSLEPDETGDEWTTLTAPDSPGTYYYGACVESVADERNTNNNCSRAIRITVEAAVPDLIVESVRSSDTTVEVGEDFTLYATVRNQGSGDARRTTLRYYRSSDSSISDADTEEDDTDSVSSLDADETSNERVTLTAPNQSGVYYYGACVDSVTDESNTRNNCSTAIKITVADAIIVRTPPGLGVGDSIVVQNASGGGLNGLIVRSGAGTGFAHIISVFNGATGTITDGPEDNNGYTWWKVRWDRSDQVFCDVNPCVGWVIEFFRGTRVIAKDDALAAPLLNAVIPTETVLLSNYPNPFNPETWIPYQLSEASNVTVSIYSVDGKLVRTLALGHKPAGVYRSRSRALHWDGRNALGELVASGLYFYTFTAGDFSATRKMLIRK